jgi:hypothetical protein
MKYQNVKTGFIFDSDSVCKGEDLILIESSPKKKQVEEVKAPQPVPEYMPKAPEEEKPKKSTKRAKKKA